MTLLQDRPATLGAGPLLRAWRRRRRLSQLDLACLAEVSTRHLSCVETGRAQPSRAFLLHLADHLDVPLRERNELLVAAGYAPVYRRTPLDAPEMAPVRSALDLVLGHHEPFPALVVDRHWNLVQANGGTGLLLDGVAAWLLEDGANVLRLSLHPDGLARRVVDRLRNARRRHAGRADRGAVLPGRRRHRQGGAGLVASRVRGSRRPVLATLLAARAT